MANEKFKALVHFIVHECIEHPSRLGAIRLNKALWFADVTAYMANGASISGETYVKRERGPVPAHIIQTLHALKDENKIIIREPEFAYDTRKYLSIGKPDVSCLSEDERELAKHSLQMVCGYSANDISEMTHDSVWSAAAEGEQIPLYATLASFPGEITETAREWASTVSSQIELAI